MKEMTKPSRNPIAFLSYVRDDDAHDLGNVTKFRERLEGEVKVQSGQRFEIFQDRNDIRWGQHWQERIVESLTEATFLIPIITPSFLVSPACRSELETFIRMEQTLGLNKLVLPVYYVSCDAIEGGDKDDPLVAAIRERNWTDWRAFRFSPLDDAELRAELAKLAKSIKATMHELAGIAEAAKSMPVAPKLTRTLSHTVQLPEDQKVSSPPWIKAGNSSAEPPPTESYWIYTSEFDETVAANELAGDSNETIQLQTDLAVEIASLKRRHLIFFQSIQTMTNQRDLAVTLLLDNSGSLRNYKIRPMAAWAAILSEWFEIAGIKYEVLGYTTRSWKGGQSKQKWLDNGKPSKPGRLCDLRHIVYKSFDDPGSNVATNCAIMMREALLKENVDGEALLWANERLKDQTAKQKVLFVLSDGAPVDDSTLSVNPGDFLAKHLAAVAMSIEQTKAVELRAVGLNYDNPFYSVSDEVDSSNLGVPVLEYIFNANYREAKRMQTISGQGERR
jgi:cobaltochelatase CobT